MTHLRISDYIAAAMPALASLVLQAVATLTLADWNNIAGICGTILGASFLMWKWRREARAKRPPRD